MSWKLNGEVVPVPETLNEALVPIQADSRSLNGAGQRQKLGAKWQVTAGWVCLTPIQYQQLLRILSADLVTYENSHTIYEGTNADLVFTGLATPDELDYVANPNLYRGLNVVIKET